MIETAAIRLARPCRDLAVAEHFYVDGLGLDVLFRGEGHGPGEYDILMLGWRAAPWHLELVAAATPPTPTEHDLLVLYLGEAVDDSLIERLEAAGGTRVDQGPYWNRWGVSVRDPDGYRLVLSSREWSNRT
jgi:catechol 2,3-dioxygenase-like lactoylglutathione lyase family enzyme